MPGYTSIKSTPYISAASIYRTIYSASNSSKEKLPVSESLKDVVKFIDFAIEENVDFIAHSFVRNKADVKEIQDILAPKEKSAGGRWVDILGLVGSESSIDSLLDSIKSGKTNSVADIQTELNAIYESYETDSYSWGAAQIKDYLDIDVANISKDELVKIVTNWKTNSLKMNTMILKDSEKED